MEKRPKISVILPAYNAEKYVARAIGSIFNQTYNNWELLVADDASRDSTKRIIESYNDERIITAHNDRNLGYTHTCNKLFEMATGDYITFQDADDYSLPQRFELQLNAFTRDTSLGICGTNKLMINEKGNELYCSNYSLTHEGIKQSFLDSSFEIIPNSFLFKREIYDTIGGYNTVFDRIGAEDFYWTWVAMQRFKIENISPALYAYTVLPNSISGDWTDYPMKRHTLRILQFLIRQREERGYDCVEQGNLNELNAYIEEVDRPYKDDPSLFYSEQARRVYYLGRKKNAVKLMLKAIQKRPFKMEHYRTLFYFARNRPKLYN